MPDPSGLGPEFDLLVSPRPDLSTSEAEALAREHFGLEGEAVALGGERDANFLIGGSHTLKVQNTAESRLVLDFQLAALEHLAVADPGLPVARVRPTRSGDPFVDIEFGGNRHGVAALTFLEGDHPDQDDPTLAHEVGDVAGRIVAGLHGFEHTAAARVLLWDPTRLPLLRPLLPLIDPEVRGVVEPWMDRYESEVAPVLPRLRHQVIHSDLHSGNLVVDAEGRLSGVIDFGDMVQAATVVDVGSAVSYQTFGWADPIEPTITLVRAFHARFPLTAEEARLVPRLAAARLAVSATIPSWRAGIDPENAEYILSDRDLALDSLRIFLELDLDAFGDRLAEACGLA